MVVLGVVEGPGRGDLGRDLALARARERVAVAAGRQVGGLGLLLADRVDGGAVLGADVVALAHALRRVVDLPERLEEIVVGDLGGVERDQDGLRVAGAAGADLVVGRVRRRPTLVADGRRVHAGQRPEGTLGAPEAAEAEVGDLDPLRERRGQRGAQNRVDGGHRHRGVATRQRVLGAGQGRLVAGREEHLHHRICRVAERYAALGRRTLTLSRPLGEVAEWLKALPC